MKRLNLLFFVGVMVIIIVYLRKRRVDNFESLMDLSNELAFKTMSENVDLGDMKTVIDDALVQQYINNKLTPQLNELIDRKDELVKSDPVSIQEDIYNLDVKGTNLNTIVSQLQNEMENLNELNASREKLVAMFNSKKML